MASKVRIGGGTRGPVTSSCHASATTCSAINISLAPRYLREERAARNPRRASYEQRRASSFQRTRERNCLPAALTWPRLETAFRQTVHIHTGGPSGHGSLKGRRRFVSYDFSTQQCSRSVLLFAVGWIMTRST